MNSLAELITNFFTAYLLQQQGASRHTVLAYRDAFKMLLSFAARGRTVDRLGFEDLSREVILQFLTHLEKERGNEIRTRNARLAALHTFFRYVMAKKPEFASSCQKILAIPFKRATKRTLGYLSEEETRNLLGHVDRDALRGERNYVLLALLYDTGARVQELLDLTPADFSLDRPAFVKVTGKGRKERICPLLPQTARLVKAFLTGMEQDAPCFVNHFGKALSRHGVRYILKKYLALASQNMPRLARPGICPHCLRHSKAMHLLQAGLPLVTIKDILGHAHIRSTEIYVEADLETRRKALEQVGTPSKTRRRGRHLRPDLLKWLESL